MEYIYVLSNPFMPGIYKIGKTNRDIEERVNELNSSTSIPADFKLELIFVVPNSSIAESSIHRRLKEFRVNPKREFFQTDLQTIVESSQILAQDMWKVISEAADTANLSLSSYLGATEGKGIAAMYSGDAFEHWNYDVYSMLNDEDFIEENGDVYAIPIRINLGKKESIQKTLDEIAMHRKKKHIKEDEKRGESVDAEIELEIQSGVGVEGPHYFN